jgi:peptidoglycan/LPS O-acetylase OafA/YrhL
MRAEANGGRNRKHAEFGVHRFYLLDILRGLASLSVVLWHFQHFYYISPGELPAQFSAEIEPFYPVLKPFYLYGERAVELFFVLSGFVFFSQYLEPIRSGDVGVWRFFSLRCSRLYPLHFVTLLLVIALQFAAIQRTGGFLIYPCNDLNHFVVQVFLASGWWNDFCWSYNAPVWSVSVEVLLYAAFFMFAVRVRGMGVALPGMILLGIAIIAFGPAAISQIGTGLICFFSGGATYHALRILGAKLALVAGISLTIAAIAVAILVDRLSIFLYAGVFSGVVLSLAAAQVLGPERGKGGRIVGDITYSTYLIHIPLQMLLLLLAAALPFSLTSEAGFVVFAGLLISLSVLSYHAFEIKAQRYLRSKMLHS